MILPWMHIGPVAIAAFFASLVEFTEAMTVVLAVGAVRGWRGALAGSFMALLVLLILVALLGPALTRIPLRAVQGGVGTLLLLFGMRWLCKAILRMAGVISLRDETAAYARERRALERAGGRTGRWDGVAIATSFKITMVEGIEVVFIVIALGAAEGDLLVPAAAGALAALLVVVLLALLLHRPVASIPENTLKLVVGVLLTGFGTFWVGEGMGLMWPAADWSVPALIAGYAGVALIIVRCCHASRSLFPVAQEKRDAPPSTRPSMRGIRLVVHELLGLVVDDWHLAVAILAWLGIIWLVTSSSGFAGPAGCAGLFAGLGLILAESSWQQARQHGREAMT